MIIENLNDELKILSSKYGRLKKNNQKMLSQLAKYQTRMWRYEQNLESLKSKNEIANLSLEKEDDYETEDIESIFTTGELNALNSVSMFKSCDRLFVCKVLQMLYKGNLDDLNNRRLSKKKSKSSVETKAITPKKIQVIYSMMHRRVNDSPAEIEEKTQRMTQEYMNQTISRALYFERNSK